MTPDNNHVPVSFVDLTKIKVDIGILQAQVSTLTMLCSKMDTVIEKLVDQHDRHLAKVYTDMEKRRIENDSDVKDIHDRIDVVLDKVSATELRLLDEIKSLRTEMQNHNKNEKETLDKLLEWKWMIVGGILVISWLFSRINLDTIVH